MALEFLCQYCSNPIQTRFLKKGETAQCKRCGKNSIIPDNAQEIEQVSDGFRPISSVDFNPNPDYAYTPTPDYPPQNEQPQIPITNPYLQIWTEPRATFRHVLDKDRLTEAILFIIASSIIGCINSFLFSTDSPQEGALTGGFGVLLFFLFSTLAFFLACILFWLCGKMLGGKGELSDIVIATGWAHLPKLVAIVAIPFGVLYRISAQSGTGNWALFGLHIFMTIILGVYILVLSIIAISEAHKITIGQSIGTLVLTACAFFLACLIFVIFIAITGLAIGGFKGLPN